MSTRITIEDSDFTAEINEDGTVQLYTSAATGDEYYHVFTDLSELKLLIATLEDMLECKRG